MNTLQRLEFWGDHHHPKYMDIARIALGIFLCYKGVDFLIHMNVLQQMLSTSRSFGSFYIYLVAHYVAFAHIAGGLLLILGVLTRFACLLQIPVLLGALFFVGFSKELYRPYSETILSIVVLLLLIYFLIAGNGPWSVHLPTDEEQ